MEEIEGAEYFKDAEIFLEGLERAKEFSMSYEYTQAFLDDFRECKDAKAAQAYALREWDL